MKTFLLKRQIIFLFSLAVFSVTNLNAQKKIKDYLLIGSCMFVSGMLDGTIESINYHYDRGFKRRFSNAGDQFWNPALSWKNKYKNYDFTQGPKFTGSTTVFVCATDAYHLMRTAKRGVDCLATVYYMNKTYAERKTEKRKKWKNMAKDFFILTAIRCVGFHCTYSVLFKQKN